MLKAFSILVVPILVTVFCYDDFSKSEFEDCNNAYKLCHLGDHHVRELQGAGISEELDINESQIQETNSFWYEFQVENPGVMEFTIVPDSNEDDIDFILYESKNGDCLSKEPVRIMTTGQTIGKEDYSSCIGNTGLRNVSDDLHEGDGCNEPDDNYLKPVMVYPGHSYYLFVNNYNSSNGFTTLFEGDENLRLKDLCRTTNPNEETRIELQTYPNPTIEYLIIKTNVSLENVSLEIFDMSGKLFLTQTLEKFNGTKKLLVGDYPSGQYYVKMKTSTDTHLSSFIKA